MQPLQGWQGHYQHHPYFAFLTKRGTRDLIRNRRWTICATTLSFHPKTSFGKNTRSATKIGDDQAAQAALARC